MKTKQLTDTKSYNDGLIKFYILFISNKKIAHVSTLLKYVDLKSTYKLKLNEIC